MTTAQILSIISFVLSVSVLIYNIIMDKRLKKETEGLKSKLIQMELDEL